MILIHLGLETLARRRDAVAECADDGLVVEV